MGDPITKEYAKMPIPACYTRSRNSSMTPYRMSSLITMLAGLFEGVPSHRVFHNIATILHHHSEEYSRPIADYLASVLFIHKSQGTAVNIIRPAIPAIYGFPLQAMIEKNRSERSTVAQLVKAVELDMAAKVTIDTTTYFFVLHQFYPKIYSTSMVPYSPSKGVTLGVPVNQYTMTALVTNQKDKSGSSVKKQYPTADGVGSSTLADANIQATSAWLDPIAWSPFTMLLPHITYDVVTPSELTKSTEFLKFAIASVRTKVDKVSGDLKMAGFVEVEAVMLDLDDFDDAMGGTDPSPISRSAMADAKSIRAGSGGR